MSRMYLAGPITGLSYAGTTEWRYQVAQACAGIDCYSPMRGKEWLRNMDVMPDASTQNVISSAGGVLKRDRYDATHCDLLFMNLLGATKVSIGSMIELGWADANQIPIIIVMEDGNPHEHAFVREIAMYTVDSLENAIALANGFLVPEAVEVFSW